MASPRSLGLADEASTEGIISHVYNPPTLSRSKTRITVKRLLQHIHILNGESHTTMVNSLQAILSSVVKCMRESVVAKAALPFLEYPWLVRIPL